MSSMRNEIRSLLGSERNETPLSKAEIAKLREACDKQGLPLVAFQYTPDAARAFMSEAFGSDDDAEKDTKKDPDGDKGEKLLDKGKNESDDEDEDDKEEPVEEGEMPDFIKKAKEKKDGEDKDDDEKDEDTTSGNIAIVPLPMGKKEENADAARIARIRARHRMAKMAESRRKPVVEMIVDSLLEDEKQ